jgi:hypothetical protein
MQGTRRANPSFLVQIALDSNAGGNACRMAVTLHCPHLRN